MYNNKNSRVNIFLLHLFPHQYFLITFVSASDRQGVLRRAARLCQDTQPPFRQGGAAQAIRG